MVPFDQRRRSSPLYIVVVVVLFLLLFTKFAFSEVAPVLNDGYFSQKGDKLRSNSIEPAEHTKFVCISYDILLEKASNTSDKRASLGPPELPPTSKFPWALAMEIQPIQHHFARTLG